MNVVLIGAMMVVMMLFSHGWRHHEEPAVPDHHVADHHAPPTQVQNRDVSVRPGQPATGSDLNSGRTNGESLPHWEAE